MRNFMDMTQDERRQHMHQCLDNTFCALMLYWDEEGKIKACAFSDQGREYDILELYAHASCKAQLMVEENIDCIQEGGEQ